MTKIGSGKLTLSAASTYTGTTTIQSGTLALSAASTNNIANSTKIIVGDTSANSGARLDVTSLTGGAITIAANQTLGGHGTVTGGVVTQANSIIAPGNSIGTLTVDTLTMAANSIYNFEFTLSPSAANDKIVVNNSNGLTINGGGFNLYSVDTTNKWLTSGTYNLIQYGGTVQGTGLDSTWTTAASNNAHILNADNRMVNSDDVRGFFATQIVAGKAGQCKIRRCAMYGGPIRVFLDGRELAFTQDDFDFKAQAELKKGTHLFVVEWNGVTHDKDVAFAFSGIEGLQAAPLPQHPQARWIFTAAPRNSEVVRNAKTAKELFRAVAEWQPVLAQNTASTRGFPGEPFRACNAGHKHTFFSVRLSESAFSGILLDFPKLAGIFRDFPGRFI